MDDQEWKARPIPELSRHRSGGYCAPRGVALRGEPVGLQPTLMSSCGCRSPHRQLNVEPLWSPAVATRGNRWQTARPLKRPRQAKTVAVGCDQLPESFHGKEGVDGSSPSEGSSKRKIPGNRVFLLSNTAPQSTSAMPSGRLFSSAARCKAPANRPAARYLGAPP